MMQEKSTTKILNYSINNNFTDNNYHNNSNNNNNPVVKYVFCCKLRCDQT